MELEDYSERVRSAVGKLSESDAEYESVNYALAEFYKRCHDYANLETADALLAAEYLNEVSALVEGKASELGIGVRYHDIRHVVNVNPDSAVYTAELAVKGQDSVKSAGSGSVTSINVPLFEVKRKEEAHAGVTSEREIDAKVLENLGKLSAEVGIDIPIKIVYYIEEALIYKYPDRRIEIGKGAAEVLSNCCELGGRFKEGAAFLLLHEYGHHVTLNENIEKRREAINKLGGREALSTLNSNDLERLLVENGAPRSLISDRVKWEKVANEYAMNRSKDKIGDYAAAVAIITFLEIKKDPINNTKDGISHSIGTTFQFHGVDDYMNDGILEDGDKQKIREKAQEDLKELLSKLA